MIARIWRGVTRAERADEYLGYLHETGLPEYAATPGYRGIRVLRRVLDGRAEFELITFWDSMASIRAFAGDEPERAVFYPQDDEYLLAKGPVVDHFEVVVDE